MAAKYPSLYADIRPATNGTTRGFNVTCTATLRPLGFVWWHVESGTVVQWHFRTDTTTGVRTTERNAVQALRDLANGALRLPLGDDARPAAPRAPRAPRAPAPRPEPKAPAAPEPKAAPAAPRIIWNDAAPAADITAALRDRFRR